MTRKVLEPFQQFGAYERLAKNAHHLLADQPGLGKTIQAIAAAERVGATNVLVVCPASVRYNWMREVREWYGEAIENVAWSIISYEGASAEPGKVARAKGPFDAIILDEAHFLKNLEAKRTAAVLGREGLARLGHYIWPMTGTPVLNRPLELFPILKTLHPVFASVSYKTYTERYCAAYWDGREMNVRGASRILELAQLIGPFITRRTKKEVYPNRAEPIVQRLEVDLTSEGKEAARALLALKPDATEISALLRILGIAKVPSIVSFVRELLETVDKVCVYAHHREVIDALHAAFDCAGGPGAVIYYGGMGDRAKDEAIRRFQGPDCRVFIGNRQAAGVGINGLQRVCSTMVIAEPSWVPGETEQIIDRLDRMGQAEEVVNAYVMVAKGTLDRHIVKVHDKKIHVVGQLVDGGRDPRSVLGDLA